MKSALDVHQALLARDVQHEVVRLRSRVVTSDDLPRVLAVEHGCVTVRCYIVERQGVRSFAAVLVPSGLVPSIWIVKAADGQTSSCGPLCQSLCQPMRL